MPFGTVGNANPYKEKPNFFMRTALWSDFSFLKLFVIPWRASELSVKLRGKITYVVKANGGGNLRNAVKTDAEKSAGKLKALFFDVFDGSISEILLEFLAKIYLAGSENFRKRGNSQLAVTQIFVNVFLNLLDLFVR